MAGLTLEIAEARLTEYLAAEAKVLSGQRVSMSGRDLTRADLKNIQEGIEIWSGRVNQLSRSGGGLRVRQVVPL